MTQKTKQKSFKQVWWKRALIAAVLFGIAYGFASWAIDSGSLLHYALSVLALYWAVAHTLRAIRLAFAR